MNFANEVDPARILSMADLELATALASPLVVFNDERQIVSGLAERWEFLPPFRIKFTLRKELAWSDGTPIEASQYKLALERAKNLYSDDLKSLFDAVENIEIPDERTVVFVTKSEVSKSGLLLKLTEPMYGLTNLSGGKVELSKSSGPYFVAEVGAGNLTLAVNRNWYAYEEGLPELIEIKRPPTGADLVADFSQDNWANLISGSSLTRSEVMEGFFKNGYQTWQRSFDKVFSLYPSRAFLESGGANFVKALAHNQKLEALLGGYKGYSVAEQFFPRGYELWSSENPAVAPENAESRKRRIKVIVPGTPLEIALSGKLPVALAGSSPAEISVEVVPLSKLNDRMKLGNYDLLATSIAVADPNFEGAMSFFIERDPPFIPSLNGELDFAEQLRLARGLRTSAERAAQMRAIIIKAQEAGHVLPLFHFSSLAVAKAGIDISKIPNTDETIMFSKIRMK